MDQEGVLDRDGEEDRVEEAENEREDPHQEGQPRAGQGAAPLRRVAVEFDVDGRLALLRLLAGGRAGGHAAPRSNNQLIDHLKSDGSIKSDAVERALRACPRGLFVPADHQHEAYVDSPIRVDALGINISAPHMHASALEALKLAPGDRVLDIGCGCGLISAAAGYLVGKEGSVVGIDIKADCVALCNSNQVSLHFYNNAYTLDAAVPTYQVQDAFIPSEHHFAAYNKIHVGAACPESRLPLLLQLLQPTGGLMLVPVDSELRLIIRDAKGLTQHVLSHVRFSELEVPSDADILLAMEAQATRHLRSVVIPPSTYSADLATCGWMTSMTSTVAPASAAHSSVPVSSTMCVLPLTGAATARWTSLTGAAVIGSSAAVGSTDKAFSAHVETHTSDPSPATTTAHDATTVNSASTPQPAEAAPPPTSGAANKSLNECSLAATPPAPLPSSSGERSRTPPAPISYTSPKKQRTLLSSSPGSGSPSPCSISPQGTPAASDGDSSSAADEDSPNRSLCQASYSLPAYARVPGVVLGPPDCELLGSVGGGQDAEGVGSWSLPAHKVLLQARCEHFRARFASGMRDAGDAALPVPDGCSCDAAASFLTYCYQDAVPGLDGLEHVVELLHMAMYYGCPRLAAQCESVLADQLLNGSSSSTGAPAGASTTATTTAAAAAAPSAASNGGSNKASSNNLSNLSSAVDAAEGGVRTLPATTEAASALLVLADDSGLMQLRAIVLNYMAEHFEAVAATAAYQALPRHLVDCVAMELKVQVERWKRNTRHLSSLASTKLPPPCMRSAVDLW